MNFHLSTKDKQYDTVGTDLKYNGKILEKSTIPLPLTQIHDHSFSWLDTGTLIKKWRS